MKKWTDVYIGGVRLEAFAAKSSEFDPEGNGYEGLYDPRASRIYVDDSCSDQDAAEVILVHEILHAINAESAALAAVFSNDHDVDELYALLATPLIYHVIRQSGGRFPPFPGSKRGTKNDHRHHGKSRRR